MTDKQLLKLVTSFRKGLLGKRKPYSMCYVVCSPLSAYLHFSGVPNEMCEGIINGNEHHWWIKLGDGRIIDPTASQFYNPNGETMPNIYFGVKPDWYSTDLALQDA